jgi:hypothetical protein
MYTEQITQRLAFANGITPQTLNNSTQTTGAVDLSLAHRAFFALYLGALSGGASINATLQVSPDNSTWSTAPGSNVSITAKTASSKLETFEIRADQMVSGSTYYRYARLSVTETGSQNALVSALAWSDEGIHKPNYLNNGTQVDTQSVVS